MPNILLQQNIYLCRLLAFDILYLLQLMCFCFLDEVIRAISPGSDEENEAEKKKQVALEQHESIVAEYKGIIREQVIMQLFNVSTLLDIP